MTNKYEGTFTINDIIGESTGELYKGTFTIKKKLSYSDLLRLDQLRRDYLGGSNQENASAVAVGIANALADLAVRVINAPSWWKDCNKGFDLVDDNVLQAIYDETMKLLEQDKIEVEKKKEEAIAKIKASQTEPTTP